MKISIQMKLLGLCLLLVLLTTVGISATYYVMTKQDKQRESRQRIQIAFDIILSDFEKRVNTYTARFNEFLKQNTTILGGTYAYSLDESEWGTISFLYDHFTPVSEELKTFGRVALADRVMLYGANKRLLVVYRRLEDQETVGGYLESEDEGHIYLEMEDPVIQSEISRRGLEASQGYYFKPRKLPETPLPPGVWAYYDGDIPDTIAISLFKEEQQLGVRIVAPIYRREDKIGILVGEALYTQSMVEEYASISKTAVNFFAGNLLSIGTLPEQPQLELNIMEQMVSCENIITQNSEIEVASFTLNNQEYYQGQCVFRDGQEIIGAITASLSQEIEKQKIQKILMTVLAVSGIVVGIAAGILVISSRKPVRFIQQLITYIDGLSKGDIPGKITEEYKGEFNDIKQNLNLLIEAMHETTRIAEEIASGNLMVDVRERSKHDRLMKALDVMVTRLSEVVIQVKSAVDNVAASSQQMSSSAENMSQGAAEQSVVTEEVSSSMEQMAVYTRQNAEDAREGGKVVSETVTAMKKIAEKITIVQDIADQTRLLSLNATIEAARAQKHGKAFSIVASEIRRLADTAKTAAAEIETLANSSVSIAERSGALLAKLVPNIEKTAELIQEISAVSGEQSSERDYTNTAIQQLNLVSQQNATAADEIAAMAVELASQAEQLQHAIAFFRI